jgi:eukaryotic-like serine/threonine-protein kinase
VQDTPQPKREYNVVHLEPRSLDDFVDAFERDFQSGAGRALKDYLPDRSDALYLPVLREIVRIDLEHGWESNRPRALDDYRTDFPELFSDAQSLQEVAFEEYRLRRRAGQSPSPEEYSRRYGVRTDGWPIPAEAPHEQFASVRVETAARSYRDFRFEAAELASVRIEEWRPPAEAGSEVGRLFRDLHAADERLAGRVADGLAGMPSAGEEFAGFRLVAELGRGAFGRVFLARQAALAGRPVALKLAPDVGGESQTLAQLQHTHIVPVYSVHRQGAVQAVCMPYCGAVTVADVTRRLRSSAELPTDGLALLAVLPEKERPAGVDTPSGPAPAVRAALAALDYPSAVLWLGGRVAEGLAHAHERGIQHRDVKPANLLLTDEGLPMLLDFNVAEDVKGGGAAAAMLGGTMPYMAPEHLAAFKGNGAGVDARADVYSLGIVLFELLTGRFPFPPSRLLDDSPGAMERLLQTMLRERSGPPPCPRKFNPTVSPATAAVVRHCLEPDPARRYQSARALSEDIERQLRHEPLLHASEPSLRERGKKWVRRHPKFGLWLSLAAVVLLTGLAAGSVWRALDLHRRAEELHLAEVAGQAAGKFGPLFREAQFQLLATAATPQERNQGEAAAREALDLFAVLEDDDWQERPLMTALPPAERARVRGEQGELLLLLAGHVSDKEEAARYNRLAEHCYDPEDTPALVWEQRGDDEQARATPVRNVRDRYLKARQLLLRKKYTEARRLLLEAVKEAPESYAVQFLLAISHEGLGNEPAACRCYSACIALMPDFYGPYVARAYSFARQHNYVEAEADLNRAIALDPDRPETYFERARARERLKGKDGKPRYAEAIADLKTAQEKGLPYTRVYFFRSRLSRLKGDRDAAKADFETGLKLTPTDAVSWDARGYARMNSDPKGALADFDEALKLDPINQNALMNKASTLAEVLDRQDEARTVLERALSAYPEYVPALAGQAVVLARLKKRDQALDLIDKALARSADGLTTYQAACVYALTSRVEPDDAATALYYLREALDLRFGMQHIDTDKDLAPVRNHPGFDKLSRLAALLRERQTPPRIRPRRN